MAMALRKSAFLHGIPLAAALVLLGCERPSTEPEPLGRAAHGDGFVLAQAGGPTVARARAELEPVDGSDARGSVEFRPGADGALEIVAAVSGMEPGTYGIHVHEVGDCSGDAASAAGDHFSPDGDTHGGPYDSRGERHAGDLGNITVDSRGEGRKEVSLEELALGGRYGVVGRAVIVHSGEDDLQSQPSGESGDPIACGVIEPAPASRAPG